MKRSPLRYPGGKSRAVKHVLPYFPEKIEKVCSPFFGGGHIELALANKGVRVYGYDKFEPVVAFWSSLVNNKKSLCERVEQYHREYEQKGKDYFRKQQARLRDPKSFESRVDFGACYYSVNRASFSGTVLSGGYSPSHPRFNKGSVQRLKDFDVQNFTVDTEDFKDSLAKHHDCFLYCDPPYLLEKQKNSLYGNQGDLHESFDHEALANILTSRTNWILSYNNTPEVLEFYKGFEVLYPNWKYGMSKDKDSKEVLIISKKDS